MVFRTAQRAGLALLLLVLPVASQPAWPDDEVESEGKGARLYGRIRGEDGENLAGARVRLHHLDADREFVSEPSGPRGTYEIRGLPFGYFELAVETPDGVYAAERVVHIPPAGKVLVVLTLAPFADASAGVAGAGRAAVQRRARGAEFWRSPRGVLILTGAGAATLLAVAAGVEESSASPFVP